MSKNGGEGEVERVQLGRLRRREKMMKKLGFREIFRESEDDSPY